MSQGKGYTNHDTFQVLEFYCSFYRVKGSSVGWNRQRMHFLKSNIKCIYVWAQDFLRTNTDSGLNTIILILLALNTRISYEWLFQNLRTKYVSLSDRICWTEEMRMNTQKHLFIQIPFNRFLVKNRWYFSRFINLNT